MHAGTDYGMALFETLVALVGVCALAVVLLRFAATRGLGRRASVATMEVVDRLALDARRSLYVVRVAGRAYLVGAGDAGAPTLLAELDPDALPKPPAVDFRGVFARERRRTEDVTE